MRFTSLTNASNGVSATAGTTHEQNTISSTAEDVKNQATVLDTKQVFVQFTLAGARVTFDGVTDPTTTKGISYSTGATALWDKIQFEKAKAIRSGGTDCVIEYQEMTF